MPQVSQFIPGRVLNKHGKSVVEKPPENFKFKSPITGIWYDSEEEYHRLLSEAK